MFILSGWEINASCLFCKFCILLFVWGYLTTIFDENNTTQQAQAELYEYFYYAVYYTLYGIHRERPLRRLGPGSLLYKDLDQAFLEDSCPVWENMFSVCWHNQLRECRQAGVRGTPLLAVG